MDKEITSFLITRILELEAKHEASKCAIGLLADKAGVSHDKIWQLIDDAVPKKFQERLGKIGSQNPEVNAAIAGLRKATP